jgi:hypothetical protein
MAISLTVFDENDNEWEAKAHEGFVIAGSQAYTLHRTMHKRATATAEDHAPLTKAQAEQVAAEITANLSGVAGNWCVEAYLAEEGDFSPALYKLLVRRSKPLGGHIVEFSHFHCRDATWHTFFLMCNAFEILIERAEATGKERALACMQGGLRAMVYGD